MAALGRSANSESVRLGAREQQHTAAGQRARSPRSPASSVRACTTRRCCRRCCRCCTHATRWPAKPLCTRAAMPCAALHHSRRVRRAAWAQCARKGARAGVRGGFHMHAPSPAGELSQPELIPAPHAPPVANVCLAPSPTLSRGCRGRPAAGARRPGGCPMSLAAARKYSNNMWTAPPGCCVSPRHPAGPPCRPRPGRTRCPGAAPPRPCPGTAGAPV